ncbi:hypothetical protein Dsin_026276 [Dipteronia sinensis]|uniref:Glycosyltransferase family 28 N-terminal domain-containing protein n=1 Tax=Dipteronia sinensis TaxID=43782 RepID=A0AAD9ZXM3_9ROSI|nr:hypothetical protein Dsin_026276 [Dipteronia sinensis]
MSRSLFSDKFIVKRETYEFSILYMEMKKKLIVEIVRIQNDGTVEVDLNKNLPAASKLLDLLPVEGPPIIFADTSFSDSNKLIPRLQIAMLVVGTRGDVQPFLAIAKRLQEFGDRVRLATHANFSTFVRSAGVYFFPLGGDPRVWQDVRNMARNKGLIPSGPGEISIQRKQLKAIIESLLLACIQPDMETGVPFRAQAIIANPLAYDGGRAEAVMKDGGIRLLLDSLAIANLSVNAKVAKAIAEEGGINILAVLARSMNRLGAIAEAGGVKALEALFTP